MTEDTGLRGLLAKATPGRWERITGPNGKPLLVAHREDYSTDLYLRGADGDLIALCPDAVALLCDMADTLAYVDPDHWRDRVGIESPESLVARFAAIEERAR